MFLQQLLLVVVVKLLLFQIITEVASIEIKMKKTTTLHIWLRAKAKYQLGKVFLRSVERGGKNALVEHVVTSTERLNEKWFDFSEVRLEKQGNFQLEWSPENTEVSYVYAFEEDTVLDEGIRILHIWEGAKLPNFDGSYHFRPPAGWISDPSGFSRINGIFHLFYQHYPSLTQWHSMHWGHAISKDLVNWIHLPVFFVPSKYAQTGGHFTGSAIPLDTGELKVYWTERFLQPEPFAEFQQCIISNDLTRPNCKTKHTVVAKLPDPSVGLGFRDPIVFRGPKGHMYMTVGTERKDGSGGVILLYKNTVRPVDGYFSGKKELKDTENWEYQGILHEDGRDELKMAECGMLVPLGDPDDPNTHWVLGYTSDKGEIQKTQPKDPEGREHMSTILVGHFNGKNFTQKFEQKFDFVGGAYAYQGFYDADLNRTFAIGWLFDGDVEKREAILSLTVPKEFVLSADHSYVMVRPVAELRKLRGKMMDSQALKNGRVVDLPTSGTAELYFQLDLEAGESFELAIVPNNLSGKKMFVRVTPKGIEIVKEWATDGKILTVDGAKPSEIRIFIDLDSVEVFCDEGRWTGTVRIPDGDINNRIQSIQLTRANGLKTIELYTLEFKAHHSTYDLADKTRLGLHQEVERIQKENLASMSEESGEAHSAHQNEHGQRSPHTPPNKHDHPIQHEHQDDQKEDIHNPIHRNRFGVLEKNGPEV